MPAQAYAFARAALGTPMPVGILVDPTCYGWPLADELAIFAAAIGRLSEAVDMNIASSPIRGSRSTSARASRII